MAIKPTNRMAQVMHRSVVSPAWVLPDTAISNCFPGLDFDFKAFWRRAFVGIVLQEWDNDVVDVEDHRYDDLKYRRLLKVDGRDVMTVVSGPHITCGDSSPLAASPGPIRTPQGITNESSSPHGTLAMEWSNVLTAVML